MLRFGLLLLALGVAGCRSERVLLPRVRAYAGSVTARTAPVRPVPAADSGACLPSALAALPRPATRHHPARPPRAAGAVVPAAAQGPDPAIGNHPGKKPGSQHQHTKPAVQKHPQFNKGLFNLSLIVCGIGIIIGILSGLLIFYGYSTSLGLSLLGLVGALAAMIVLIVGLVTLIISLF